ncbi:MAG: hypothetical protein IPL79_11935 [Myxococcales bacterium]|nr:hypothetical protein [Myxococcales bacterium]
MSLRLQRALALSGAVMLTAAVLGGCLGSNVQSHTTMEVSGGRLLPEDMVELRVRTALVQSREEKPWFANANTGAHHFSYTEVGAHEVLMQLSLGDGRCKPSKAATASRKSNQSLVSEPLVWFKVGAIEAWWRLYDRSFRIRSPGGKIDTIEVGWDLRQLWALPGSSIVFTGSELIDVVSKVRIPTSSYARHADFIIAVDNHENELIIARASDLQVVSRARVPVELVGIEGPDAAKPRTFSPGAIFVGPTPSDIWQFWRGRWRPLASAEPVNAFERPRWLNLVNGSGLESPLLSLVC